MATLEGNRGLLLAPGSGGGVGKSGIPYFATPWIELGKLEERERWQALAVDLVEHSITSELQELKHSLTDPLARLPELKQNMFSKVDQAQTKISSLVAEYRKLLSTADGPEGSLERKAIIQALQHDVYGTYELDSIPSIVEGSMTMTVTEEFAVEEDEAHAGS